MPNKKSKILFKKPEFKILNWNAVPLYSSGKLNCIIEIPMGSSNKYETDKETGFIFLSRPLFSPMYYPGNYGFIPQTLWYDGDPLDVLVLSSFSLHPGIKANIVPIGVIKMQDKNQNDAKILAVLSNDPRYSSISSIKDLPKHLEKEIIHFFSTYKELEKIKVKVFKIAGRQEAIKTIKKAHSLYLSAEKSDNTI